MAYGIYWVWLAFGLLKNSLAIFNASSIVLSISRYWYVPNLLMNETFFSNSAIFLYFLKVYESAVKFKG